MINACNYCLYLGIVFILALCILRRLGCNYLFGLDRFISMGRDSCIFLLGSLLRFFTFCLGWSSACCSFCPFLLVMGENLKVLLILDYNRSNIYLLLIQPHSQTHKKYLSITHKNNLTTIISNPTKRYLHFLILQK